MSIIATDKYTLKSVHSNDYCSKILGRFIVGKIGHLHPCSTTYTLYVLYFILNWKAQAIRTALLRTFTPQKHHY